MGSSKPRPRKGASSRGTESVISKIMDGSGKAAKAAADEGVERATADPPDAEVNLDRLRRAWTDAEQQRKTYQRCKEQADLREKEAERFRDEYRTKSDDLAERRAELERRDADAAALRDALNDRDRALAEREQQIRDRELEAERGFARRNEEVRADHQRELQEKQTEIARLWEDFGEQRDAERQRQRRLLDEERAAWEARQDEELQQLSREQREIAKARANLVAEEGRIAVERETIEAERDQLELRIEALAADRVQALKLQLETAEETLTAARAEVERCRSKLADQEGLVLASGQRLPEEAARLLRRLEDECADLRRQLAERPEPGVLEQLERLSADHRASEEERAWLKHENARLAEELSSAKLSVTENERLRDTETAYRAVAEGYREAMKELTERYEHLVERAKHDTAFPNCTRMDNDPGLKMPPQTGAIPALDKVVTKIQGLLLHDRENPLKYREQDIRSFLAGLATSRLHLLQGISGIGKTSLPRAFAKAIGAGHAVVEVQAGWRDRQDLFGYYNTFERQFHETNFLQALYRAQCPAYQGRPFFIVLDEMNLSHPEQYFADLLSKLENPDREPIELLPRPVGDPPRLLVGGKAIKLPDNVWFIGTANHDETTVDFADKTYDRAYVLELPYPRPAVTVPEATALRPVSLAGLGAAFDAAEGDFAGDGDRLCQFLGGPLRDDLLRTCGIGWGDRLEEQARRYTAVVRAAGGTLAEAADHVLATKILRKVRGKYEISGQHLTDLEQSLKRHWQDFGLDGTCEAASALLAYERRVRGGV